MQILILFVWEGSKILHFNILPGVYQMNKKLVRIIDCLSPGNRFLLENEVGQRVGESTRGVGIGH